MKTTTPGAAAGKSTSPTPYRPKILPLIQPTNTTTPHTQPTPKTSPL
ncbi:MAG: hypothetical protein KAW12_11200 [Candidatus Aminicenantes bacterium]|nr:hypothetical protein [Candidatus Aminicenantes bacterium]